MTYQPVVPFGGLAGWTFLTRTRDAQQEAFNTSFALQRNTDYFRENIGSIQTAEALVNDRQLLEVALGAFGLGEDINSKFFIQKILEDGTIDPSALANRLADKRYERFSEAFGFGNFSTPNTNLSTFADDIIGRYQAQQFEEAVGATNNDMRLALSLDRALDEILAEDTTDDGLWYLVMGQPPVRQVFETALNLPTSFGALSLEQQLSGFRDKLSSRLGGKEISQFSDPTKREELLRLFLAQSEIQSIGSGFTANSAALTLLQGAAQPSLL
jgi:hypothetical protein